ncbi:MAG: secretin N-terminal domain-containing protein [Gemmatimonadales bacterium]
MNRVMLALAGLALGVPSAYADPGEVTAVSILPGAGRVLVVIDVRGSVSVQDFTLRHPDRLVIDVVGAKLRMPRASYDGQNRGGIRDIRYAQFRPDVVRIVLELEELKDYELEYSDDAIRVTLGSDRAFTAWSSTLPVADVPPPAREEPRPPSREEPTPLARAVQAQQPLVHASWDSAPIEDVMAGFSRLSGKSIVLGSGAGGRFVTAEIRNQPWDVAFKVILESQGLHGDEETPGIIRIVTDSALAVRDSLEPQVTRIFPLDYARATQLAGVLNQLLGQAEQARVVADTGTNSLIITDRERTLQQHEQMIRQLDQPVAQVSIQAKLIFVDRTNVEELGIRYDLGGPDAFFNRVVQRLDPAGEQVAIDLDGDGVPDQTRSTEFFDPVEVPNVVELGGNSLAAIANASSAVAGPALELIFSTAIGNFTLTSFVEALQRVDLADLQAEPLTTAVDNTKARILVGEKTPIRVLERGAQVAEATVSVDFQESGIRLEVTPHVTNNRQVLMHVFAENSRLQPGLPDVGFTFTTQEAEGDVLVDDGQTAVIGGLTLTQVTVSKSGIPFLVDLPIIGGLFGFTSRSETRRDLLILITPHIIDNPAQQPEMER